VPFFEDGASFDLPEPIGLLSWQLSHNFAEIAANYAGWVRSQLCPTSAQLDAILSAQSDVFVGLCYPGAAPERACVLSRLTALLFLVDDVTTQAPTVRRGATTTPTPAILDVILCIMRGEDASRSTDDPGIPAAWVAEASRVFASLRAGMAGPQWDRFAKAMGRWVAGTVGEAAPRTESVALSFEDLVALRLLSSGSEPYAILVEYGLGIDLSGLDQHQQLRQIYEAMARHTVLTNDLHSFRAEHYRGDHVNAVAMGCLVDGLSLQDSVNRVCETIADAERSFVDRRAEMLAAELGRRRAVRGYLDGMGHIMAGNPAGHTAPAATTVAVTPGTAGLTGR
jgi:hypothetical protein